MKLLIKFAFRLFLLGVVLFCFRQSFAQPNANASSFEFFVWWNPLSGTTDFCYSPIIGADTTGNTPAPGDTTFYYWDFGTAGLDTLYQTSTGATNGTIFFGYVFFGFSSGPTFTSGCHNVQLTVSNSTGSTTTNFIICNNTPTLTFDPFPSNICFGSSEILSGTTNIGLADSVQWSFLLSYPGGTPNFGNAYFDTTTSVFSLPYTFDHNTGYHYFEAEVWVNGCSNTIVDSILVNDPGNADFSFSSGCPCNEIQFTDQSTNANNYAWSFGDGESSTSQSPNHSFQEPGPHFVNLTIEDGSGCKSISNQIVEVCPNDILDDTALSKANNNFYTLSDWGLSFNSGTAVASNPIGNSYAFGSTYSNPYTGQVSFYVGSNPGLGPWASNACIYNANHVIISNMLGDKGHFFHTIVPHPGNGDQYYVFYIDHAYSTGGNLYYTIVDMSLNGGQGGVVSGQENIFVDSDVRDLSAFGDYGECPADQNFWLATYSKQDNLLKAYEITGAGIGSATNSSTSSSTPYEIIEYSNSGNMLSMIKNNGIDLWSFDINSGTFKFFKSASITSTPPSSVSPTTAYSESMCFSPDDSKVYIANRTSGSTFNIYQVDLLPSNPNVTLLYSQGPGNNPVPREFAPGPDNKIYIGSDYWAGTTAYQDGVINDPNNAGFACNINMTGVPFNSLNPAVDDPQLKQSILPRHVPLDTLTADFEVDTIPCFTYDVHFSNLSDSLDLAPCSFYSNDTIYFWDFGDGNTSADMYPVHSYGAPGTYTVKLYTHHPYYCTEDSTELDITIDPIPSINETITNVSCFGNADGAIDLTIAGGSTPISYFWPFNSSTLEDQSSLSAGNYDVTITFDGCDTTLSYNITEPPLVTPPNAGTDATYCQGTSMTNMTATAGAGGTLNWYSDTGLTMNIGTGTTLIPNNTIGTTTYYVTETVNGCESAASTIDITINANPTAPNAGVDATYCQGDPMIDLTATTSSGGILNWYSDAGLMTNIGTGTTLAPNNTIGTTTYYVTETVNGCESTASTIDITINANPTAPNAGVDATYCQGDPMIDLTATTSSGGILNWYSDAGLTTNIGTGLTLSPNNTIGTTTYYVTETVNGCESSASTVDITINTIPTAPNAGPNATYCENEVMADLTAGAGSGGVLTWYSDAILTNSIGTGSVLPPVSTLGTTSYYVTETVNGCESPASVIDITVNPAPSAPSAGTDTTYCQGDLIVDLTATSGSGGILNWYSDMGLTNDIGTGATLTPNSIVGTTTYYVAETVNGCESQATSVDITINAVPQAPQLNSITTTYCPGESLSSIIATPSSGGTINWYSNPGLTNNIGIGSAITPGNNVGVSTYYATEVINGCESSASQISITIINPSTLPSVTFNAPTVSGCAPLTVDFSSNVQGASACYWEFGDGNTSSTCSNISYVYDEEGCYDVTLTVTTSNGCKVDTTIENFICVSEGPIADFSQNFQTVSEPQTVVQFMNTSINSDHFSWNFYNETSSTEVSPEHEFPYEPGVYDVELVAFSSNGCSDTSRSVVIVEEELIFYVPNTFTPDGDEHNNIFKPIMTSGYDPYRYTLFIFNRWGELLFESHNAQVGWDGTYQGQLVQDGTYVWKIIISDPKTDEKKEFMGHINLLK